MLDKPIEFNLYNEDGSVKGEYKLCMLPWGFMKKATALSKRIESAGEDEEKTLDEMAQFASDMFRGKFTAQDVNDYADAPDVTRLLNEIMAYINQNPNSAAGSTTQNAAPQK